MSDMARRMAAEPFFQGFSDGHLRRLAGCASLARFPAGTLLLRQNAPAQHFFLLTAGQVLLKAHLPHRGTVPLETLGGHDALGFSWLVPPYKWHYDARALEETEALSFAADCLRRAMEDDHDLGYLLQGHIIGAMSNRLQAARLQGLDLYGNPGAGR